MTSSNFNQNVSNAKIKALKIATNGEFKKAQNITTGTKKYLDENHNELSPSEKITFCLQELYFNNEDLIAENTDYEPAYKPDSELLGSITYDWKFPIALNEGQIVLSSPEKVFHHSNDKSIERMKNQLQATEDFYTTQIPVENVKTLMLSAGFDEKDWQEFLNSLTP